MVLDFILIGIILSFSLELSKSKIYNACSYYMLMNGLILFGTSCISHNHYMCYFVKLMIMQVHH